MTSKPTSRLCHECNEEWSAESHWNNDEVWICDNFITVLGLPSSPYLSLGETLCKEKNYD